jgi:hypothetical protein
MRYDAIIIGSCRDTGMYPLSLGAEEAGPVKPPGLLECPVALHLAGLEPCEVTS